MIIVISGPGGVGKGTICKRLVSDYDLKVSRSWTTRARRPGESEDAYVFVVRPTFERRIAEGGFLEYAEFNGNFYGTPVLSSEELADGEDVILEIETQGARNVRDRVPASDRLLIFIMPPGREELARRMRERGDDERHISERLELSAVECADAYLFDFVVINDDLARAIREIWQIIRAVHEMHATGF